MNKNLRATVVVLATLACIAIGAIAPLAARGMAWRSATWTHAPFLALLILLPFILWKTTLAVDARVPRLRLGAVAPIIAGPRGLRGRFRDLPGILRTTAMFFIVLALARPQDVLRGEQLEERGIDIVLVLDLSGSMRAVMDGDKRSKKSDHRPTRLDVAKDVISDFVSRRKTDRIGVVVFGKSAFVLSPPTLDYPLVSGLVQKMDLDVIDGSATAIGDAIGVGVARLRRSTARSKAIILLTDGDSNAGTIAPEYATHLAQTQGIRIYTIQIGNGDEVDVQDGVDLFGQAHYARAHFPVNPELLKKMTQETGGESFVATDQKGLEQSMHAILNRLEKTRFLSQAASMEDLFPFLLFPAVAFVVLEAIARIWIVRRFP